MHNLKHRWISRRQQPIRDGAVHGLQTHTQ